MKPLERVFKALSRRGLDVSYIEPFYHLAPKSRILLPPELEIEADAFVQLASLASTYHPDGGEVLRAFATPDFHPGDTGVAIGSVLETRDMILPAAVGTDINCGMRLHMVDLTLEEFLPGKEALLSLLHGDYLLGTRDIVLTRESLKAVLAEGLISWVEHARHNPQGTLAQVDFEEIERDIERVYELGSRRGDLHWAPDNLFKYDTTRLNDIATIGRGNHFVEIQEVAEILDPALAWGWQVKKGSLALMVHSGSRDIGRYVGQVWKTLTREQWPAATPYPASGMFPVVGEQVACYISAENTAANYGFLNRLLLAELFRVRARQVFGKDLQVPLVYDTPHNFTERVGDRFVCRKGACPAHAGSPVIIPGSMGTDSYLMVGLGQESTLQSASHGAGRAASRGSMRHKDPSLEGIQCITLREERRIEEAPSSYKDIHPVIESQVSAGMVGKVARLRPIVTFKA